MAYSITTIQNSIETSIYGRRLGLKRLVSSDANSQALVGVAAEQLPIADATSDTTGTNITGYGITSVDTTTDDGWLLDNPIPGVRKVIYTGSTSTGIRTVKRKDNTFAIRSSASSTLTTILAQGGGLTLELIGISSALYGVIKTGASTELSLNGTT